jgi:hypothetical protein
VDFFKEWEQYKKTPKLKIMKKFAFTTNFTELEKDVYNNLNYSIPEIKKEVKLSSQEQINKNKELKNIYETYKKFYSQF